VSSQKETEKGPQSVTAPQAGAAAKASEPAGAGRELTDEEIARVAGGQLKRIVGPGESVAPP
jgi:hypothetical protein